MGFRRGKVAAGRLFAESCPRHPLQELRVNGPTSRVPCSRATSGRQAAFGRISAGQVIRVQATRKWKLPGKSSPGRAFLQKRPPRTPPEKLLCYGPIARLPLQALVTAAEAAGFSRSHHRQSGRVQFTTKAHGCGRQSCLCPLSR